MAIFYRTNAQSRVFEEVFIGVGLPYKVVGGAYALRAARDPCDVSAYLRCSVDPADSVSLRRIVNVPKRGIGPKIRRGLAQRTGSTFLEETGRPRIPEIATRSLRNMAWR